jgi:KaiC/GvpD/RAD55 family RecA-like ATPase
MDLLTTNISTAFWCSMNAGSATYQPAQIALEGANARSISWLDELLKGGIRYFENKPLTLLLAGPPGTGKTTLAMELCYRLANRDEGSIQSGMGRRSSLFVSTDSDTAQLIEHVRSFRWEDVDHRIVAINAPTIPTTDAAVAVWGSENIRKWDTLLDLVGEAADALLSWLRVLPPNIVGKLMDVFRIQDAAGDIVDQLKNVGPHVVVLDGINALAPADKGDVFQAFMKGLRSARHPPHLVVLILDTGQRDVHPAWEYVCDLVIRLDHRTDDGYYRRTIEICKARYQEHVWGTHQVKLYPGKVATEDDEPTLRRRAHPYRTEGGLYIYPSIHYWLSAYKRSAPVASPSRASTVPSPLNALLHGGYPLERCTAFIGDRGTHKSHLGYLHILHRILKDEEERGLIVSLRDDEAVTRQALAGIVQHELLNIGPAESVQLIQKLEMENRLEILYFVPGYITPEEFLHRMLMSVYRMKTPAVGRGRVHLTTLFNSLDQLTARFPLCATERIFVPGVIEVLTGAGVTALVVAVEEPGQPPEQYGLLSMADLIIRFNRYRLNETEYFGHLSSFAALDGGSTFIQGTQESVSIADTGPTQPDGDSFREVVILQVERFSGGQAAGARAMVEFVDPGELFRSVYSRCGLHLVPLNQRLFRGRQA